MKNPSSGPPVLNYLGLWTMPEIITIKAHPLKLEGPGFVAERNVARMTHTNWLKLRKTGLGGTDISAEIYPDDYAGPLTVYFDKLTPVSVEERQFSWRMFRGNWSEDPMRNTVLPTFLLMNGASPPDFRIYTSPWFYRSTELPWLTCNIDGLIQFFFGVTLTDGTFIPPGMYVLELKTADYSKRDLWADGQTPDRYYTQAHHYCRGLKTAGAIVFALIGDEPCLRYLPAHPEFHALIEKTGAEAWRQIQDRDPPAAFGGDSDLRLVRKLYPVGGESARVLEGLEPHVEALVEARKRMKEAKADTKRAEAFLKSEIGDASGLVSPDGNTGVKWTRGLNKAGRPINRLTPRVNGKEEEEEEE